MVRYRNLCAQSKTYLLDGMKGKEMPETTRRDGRLHKGGVNYPTITFGAYRTRADEKHGVLGDIQELSAAEEKSSSIQAAVRREDLRKLSAPAVAARKPTSG